MKLLIKTFDILDYFLRGPQEIDRLKEIMQIRIRGEETIQLLESLRETNLEKVSFTEKNQLLAKLGIKVYPSGDSNNLKITQL